MDRDVAASLVAVESGIAALEATAKLDESAEMLGIKRLVDDLLVMLSTICSRSDHGCGDCLEVCRMRQLMDRHSGWTDKIRLAELA